MDVEKENFFKSRFTVTTGLSSKLVMEEWFAWYHIQSRVSDNTFIYFDFFYLSHLFIWQDSWENNVKNVQAT